jgi:hypothetical protein
MARHALCRTGSQKTKFKFLLDIVCPGRMTRGDKLRVEDATREDGP